MIIQKDLPDVGEKVLIRIKKVMPFGAYCELIEYGIDAYLPIKEVASGWIKNIHEFIKDGSRDVAEVIFVDKEKRAVDVSLKKVNTKAKKAKLSEYSLEKRGEKLFLQAAALAGMQNNVEGLKKELATNFETYSDLMAAVAGNSPSIEGLKIDKKFIDALRDVVSKNIKPKIFKVSYVAELVSQNPKFSINEVKKLFSEVEALGVKVTYLGAPRYLLSSEDSSYPEAEEKIKQVQSIIEKYSKADGFLFSLKKEKA